MNLPSKFGHRPLVLELFAMSAMDGQTDRQTKATLNTAPFPMVGGHKKETYTKMKSPDKQILAYSEFKFLVEFNVNSTKNLNIL